MANWIYENKPITELPEKCIGFVYIITNLKNNRKYIGKKLARFKKSRPPLKGKVNKRRYTVESDWQTYYGSNDELTIDVETLGTENFKREIEKEKESASFNFVALFVNSLFPLIDNFEIAIKQDNNPKEIESLYKTLQDFMDNLNIVEVPGVGEVFDPNFHEAVEHSGDGDTQTIEEVLRKRLYLGRQATKTSNGKS